MRHSLEAVAGHVNARVVGDRAVQVMGIASLASAKPGDLVFVEDEVHLPKALQSHAAAVIAGNFAEGAPASKPLLISDQPRLAFARAATLFASPQVVSVGVHATAIVHPSVRMGRDIIVEERAVIGDGSRIGAGCVMGENVSIGCNCQIYPQVTIYKNTRLGNRVIVHAGAVLGSDGFGYVRDRNTGHYSKSPQIGTLEIEDDVEIGANATIDRGALDTTR